MKNNRIIISGLTQLNRLERYIEEICDHFNIHNDYFGNILMASCEAARIILIMNDSGDKGNLEITIDRSGRALNFKISLITEGISFIGSDRIDTEVHRYKLSKELYIVKSLTDELIITPDGKSIKLTFFITSISFEKELQRIKQLKEYWSRTSSLVNKRND